HMRLIAFDDHGNPALGARIGAELINLTGEGLPASLEEFLRGGSAAQEAAERLLRRNVERRPISGLRYLPPVRRPAKAIAVGLSYRDHASESAFAVPDYPVLFQRFPSSWVGHQEPLVRPALSLQLDYEGELAVIIGRPGRRIDVRHALEHVAGYSLFNDGSIR